MPTSSRSIRRSLFDPIVLSALITMGGGGFVFYEGNKSDDLRHRVELEEKRRDGICTRAFAYLQDEAVNPRLEKDDGFYEKQRSIAERCSAGTF